MFGSNVDEPNRLGLNILFKNVNKHLGLSIFDPDMGWNNPTFYRVYLHLINMLMYYAVILLTLPNHYPQTQPYLKLISNKCGIFQNNVQLHSKFIVLRVFNVSI